MKMPNKDFKLEKVPNEADINILEHRVIIMFVETFIELARRIQEVIGPEAKGVLYDAGIYSGKRSVNVLLNAWSETGDSFIKKWSDFYSSSGVGWFKVKDIDIDLKNGTGYIRIIQSFAVEDVRKGETRTPMCHFLMGFFVGVFEVISGKKLECEEVKCISKNAPYCEFQFVTY